MSIVLPCTQAVPAAGPRLRHSQPCQREMWRCQRCGAQLHPACEVAGQAGKGHRGEALPCIPNVEVGVEERPEGRGKVVGEGWGGRVAEEVLTEGEQGEGKCREREVTRKQMGSFLEREVQALSVFCV